MDKAYNDYAQFARWTRDGVYFVTRIKKNALLIQVWTALIALLLLKWLHHLSKAKWCLSVLGAMLRLNLFTYRDLRDWLDDPYHTPPLHPEPEQLALAFL